MEYEDESEEEKYQKGLSIIPIKFRNIECDKLDKIKQGTEKSVFITGPIGVGKTVLMAGIVKNILKVGDSNIKWISYPSFIMELQSLYRKNEGLTPFEVAQETASFPGTLCIDDIGAEKMTGYVQQITYYIINYREQEMLHTIITSNFSLRQIAEQIDPRVSSRIVGMCKMVKLAGKDRRKEEKNKGEIKKQESKKREAEIEEEEFEPDSHVNFREVLKKKSDRTTDKVI